MEEIVQIFGSKIYDLFLLFVCFYIFIVAINGYSRIQTTHLPDKKRLKLVELLIFLSLLYVFIQLLYLIDFKFAYIYDNIGFTFAMYIMYISLKKTVKDNENKNAKYTKIKPVLDEILSISGADRVGLVEYHQRFASLTMLAIREAKYNDVMGQWTNLPQSSIVKWRADDEWLEVKDVSKYKDVEIKKIAMSYNHKSIYHRAIKDIDDYSIGYISIMYCEDTHILTEEEKTAIEHKIREIADISKEDKFKNNIGNQINMKYN